MTDKTRTEKDTLGAVEVPADALYGAQTARAVANFPISGWTMPGGFMRSLAEIKRAFALANGERGLLPREPAETIAAAAAEIAAGAHRDQFPVDVFQTGSGTSTNMNVNEVIAHLANRMTPGFPVHPNDHVNLGQSSNDVVPTALRLAAAAAWRDLVRPAALAVGAELTRLASAHRETVTLGRTHLMDGVPTTYGRVFAAWAARVAAATDAGDAAADALLDVPLGGTAVGSGIGADPAVVARVVELLRAALGLDLRAMSEPAVGIAAQEAPIAMGDALAGLGRVLLAIANDLRLRGSGPSGGLAELRLPAVQPGSSIMPGKVNPVIPEAVVQVGLEVDGLAHACRQSATLHQLDLSHANPLLAWNLDAMATLLAGACRALATRCLAGLDVDIARARSLAESSPALATALARRIGYERAAEVAKAAERAGESVLAAARRLAVLPDAELAELLDLDRMAGASKQEQGTRHEATGMEP